MRACVRVCWLFVVVVVVVCCVHALCSQTHTHNARQTDRQHKTGHDRTRQDRDRRQTVCLHVCKPQKNKYGSQHIPTSRLRVPYFPVHNTWFLHPVISSEVHLERPDQPSSWRAGPTARSGKFPEIKTAPFQLQNFRSTSPTAWWRDKPKTLFHVFRRLMKTIRKTTGRADVGARGDVRPAGACSSIPMSTRTAKEIIRTHSAIWRPWSDRVPLVHWFRSGWLLDPLQEEAFTAEKAVEVVNLANAQYVDVVAACWSRSAGSVAGTEDKGQSSAGRGRGRGGREGRERRREEEGGRMMSDF